MIFSLLVAYTKKNRGMGVKNTLPWHLPEDLKYFKKITSGHPIIMGRKTFESLNRLLPNRFHIIITTQENYLSNSNFDKNKFKVIGTINKAFEYCHSHFNETEEIFIIGGADIFRQTIDRADRLYVTEISNDYNADTFFPSFDNSKWTLINKKNFKKDNENESDMLFLTYKRKNNEKKSNQYYIEFIQNSIDSIKRKN